MGVPDTNGTGGQEINQASAGGAYENMQLRTVTTPKAAEDFEEAITSTGYACPSVSQISVLVQNGQDQPIFKADCSNEASYQITGLNGKAFVKPWTGTLFGQ